MRLLPALLATLTLVPSAGGTAGLAAVGVRAGDHPAYVRVVVDFAGGVLGGQEPTLLDAAVWAEGRTRIEVAHPGVSTEAPVVRALGLRFASVQGRGRISVELEAAPRRFKYVSYRVLHSPERLVIDLWKAGVPTAAATIRDDGCLRITSYAGGPHVAMAGRELRWLFEHTVVVRLRSETGRLLAERPLIASRGRWGTSFTYTVARRRRATLEAISQSAKDGALDCLVQVPVVLRPG